MSKYMRHPAEVSLTELQEIYGDVCEQYGDLRAEHEGECAAFGDSWVGAQEQVSRLYRGMKELEEQIKNHPDYVAPTADPVDLSLWKLPEGEELPF